MGDRILTVVFGNWWAQNANYATTGEILPLEKRSVQIVLTDEQMAMIAPRVVGSSWSEKAKATVPRYEEILECWLEPLPGGGE